MCRSNFSATGLLHGRSNHGKALSDVLVSVGTLRVFKGKEKREIGLRISLERHCTRAVRRGHGARIVAVWKIEKDLY